MTTRTAAASVPVATLSTLAILGVASVLAVLAVVRGPSGPSSSQFVTSGPSVLTITADGAQSLTAADVDAIARSVPDVAAFSRVVSGSALVTANSQGPQVLVEGVDPTYAQVTNRSVARGTFFTTQDAVAANPVAILGQTLATSLFTGRSPVGQIIRIRNVPFTVIGVLSSQGGESTDTADNAILIPFQTGQIRLFGPNSLSAVLLRVGNTSQTEAVSQNVAQLLRQRHRIRAGQPDGFAIRTSANTSATQGSQTPIQFLSRVWQHYREFACEAKGLCGRAQPS